ncbi:hypothetical protein XELAEV_18031447mg [Xenopus laevis]|uniref:Uncharacterized protein n=1 Tax=Xenopus laevis TaxID=8355 RepID=A0A974CMN3_XENLA|nr:hypothetical protein XELAEV_18031447mg [Xenopus laevis]
MRTSKPSPYSSSFTLYGSPTHGSLHNHSTFRCVPTWMGIHLLPPRKKYCLTPMQPSNASYTASILFQNN